MQSSAPLFLGIARLTALALCEVPRAVAQNLFVIADRTIAGGSPVNGSYGNVIVGADAGFNPYANVLADFTGGTAAFLAALNGSTVNISGGTIGIPASGNTSYSSLSIAAGSTINLSGGTLLGPVFVNYTASGEPINTFNMSGGSVAGFIENTNGGIVNISGGSVVGVFGFTGQVSNYGSGTINFTGGSVGTLVSAAFYDPNGTVNVGGTAVVNAIYADGGVTNIAGGTVGAGGVTVRNDAVANFTGSGLTVNQVSSGAFFDEGYFVNLIVAQYTVAGTLANGNAVNTTVSGGTTYSNDGSTATFGGAAIAPDIFVMTNQTVTGVYNNVNVGIDETYSVSSDPTATITAGTDTVYLTTFSNSVTNMTGGVVRGGVSVTGTSQFNLSGGQIGAVDSAFGAGSTINISGGTTGYLGVGGTATVSGGAVDFVELFAGGTLIV